MATTTVSSKGQITIPQAIRKALAIEEGDEVILTVDGDEARLQVRKRRRLTDLYGALPAQVPYREIGETRRQARRDAAARRYGSGDA